MGTGRCFTVCDITIVELNPPEVKNPVRGLRPHSYEPTFKEFDYGIEDLIPVASKETVVETKLLKIDIAPEMNRVPKCPIDDCILKWMRAGMDSLLEECSLSQSKILDDVVEVIDVSTGMQKQGSLPMLQCRAKMEI